MRTSKSSYGGRSQGRGSTGRFTRNGLLPGIELLLAFYYAGIIAYCMFLEKLLALPLMLLFLVGPGCVRIQSLNLSTAPAEPTLVPAAS